MTKPTDLVHAYGYANNFSQFDSQGGLTKREHFAVMAMQGLLTRVPYRDLGTLEGKRMAEESIEMAEESIEMADNLIAELNKQQ